MLYWELGIIFFFISLILLLRVVLTEKNCLRHQVIMKKTIFAVSCCLLLQHSIGAPTRNYIIFGLIFWELIGVMCVIMVIGFYRRNASFQRIVLRTFIVSILLSKYRLKVQSYRTKFGQFVFFFVAEESCSTPDGQPGLCIPVRSCDPLLELLVSKPLSAQNRTLLARSQCAYRNETPYVTSPQRIIYAWRVLNFQITLLSTGVLFADSTGHQRASSEPKAVSRCLWFDSERFTLTWKVWFS